MKVCKKCGEDESVVTFYTQNKTVCKSCYSKRVSNKNRERRRLEAAQRAAMEEDERIMASLRKVADRAWVRAAPHFKFWVIE